ncbi:MAG: hypothetical protein NWE77_06815 [Candidatus Bathyarchaeota archaeon]|nr:hypothetical protein [Candidatus Bathyarchaeota archaeon]
MKKTFLPIACVVIYLSIAVFSVNAETISKPSVTLPSYWHLEMETPYPEAYAEYDPQGAGMLMYVDEVDFDCVMVFYERAPSTTLTETTLETKATEIFLRDHEYTPSETGTKTVAGSPAGYAKGYDYELDVYDLELVFVKGSTFLNVYAVYDPTPEDENGVMSLIDSILVQEPTHISCAVNTFSIVRGQDVTIHGAISPSVAYVQVTISIYGPDGSTTITTNTDEVSNYAISYTPSKAGAWTFRASWQGDDLHEGAQSESTSLAVETPWIEVWFPYIALMVVGAMAAIAVIMILVRRRRKPTARPPSPQYLESSEPPPQYPESPEPPPRSEDQPRAKVSGVGELVIGIVLIIIFLATLSIEQIPIIWTGALIGGIITIISGLYKMARALRSHI